MLSMNYPRFIKQILESEGYLPSISARAGGTGVRNIAMYSPESVGLGHLRRNTLIGRQLLEDAGDSNVLLFANSPAAPFFELPDGMDLVKLPSVRKISAGNWGPARLRMDKEQLKTLRADLLRSVLLNYRPDLLLVNHMPAHPDCFVVLGLRDILDAPEVTSRAWETEGAYEALRRYYDRILIYGSKEMFGTCCTYQLPVPPGGLHYCGYLVSQVPVKPAHEIRQGIGLPFERFVFVSAGGGSDGQLLMRTYLQAVRLLGRRVDFATLMAVGANAPLEIHLELEAEAQGLPVRIVPHVEDGPSHIAAADLVVCMAGYNTLSEVLYLKKKALVVPRDGPSAEQRMRAGLLAKKRLIDVLDPTDLSPEKLAQRLVEDLERNDYPVQNGPLPMDGIKHAADRLLELVR